MSVFGSRSHTVATRGKQRRAGSAVAAGLAALLLAGCGAIAPGAVAPSAAVSSAAIARAPLPIEQRVVQGNLAGLTSREGTKTARTVDEFLRLLAASAGADAGSMGTMNMSDAGFVLGAVKAYGDPPADFGVSLVVQTTSASLAPVFVREFDKAFTEGAELGPEARTGTLSGPTTSHTLTHTENGAGIGYASFIDGPFAYVVVAAGPAVKPQAVLDAASNLYESVKGSPAA